MYPFELRRIRQSIDAGQTLSTDDARALLDQVETLRHAVRQPTELHLTARIDADDPSRWTIDHPLLTAAVHASDVADAVTLAAIDLRRNLEPAEHRRRDRFARIRIDRAEWRTLAAQSGPAAEALAGAMQALESAESDRDDARAELDDVRWLRRDTHDSSGPELDEARRRQRQRSLERLAEVGVKGVDLQWRSDGFASGEHHGVPLPALVVATPTAHSGGRLRHRFDGQREWIALEHLVSDGIRREYLTMIATIVEPTREAEHALRLLSLEIPGRGNTISHLCAYRDATTNLLGAHVSVAGQRGAVGGGCWPFDLSSIARLTGGMITPDDFDTWASQEDDDPLFSFAPHWELLWLADAPDDWR